MSLAQVNGPKQGKDKVLSGSWATLLRGLGHWRHCFIRIRNSRATAPGVSPRLRDGFPRPSSDNSA